MTNDQWENVLNRAGAVLNFGIEKKKQVQNSKMAKFIAAIPYLAGCNKATETSFSHLIIYLMSLHESAKDIYFHNSEDDKDIYSRLFPISSFLGGDKIIIQTCMDLLALCMLSNYKNDAEQDKIIGKYNPLNTGKWNYNFMSEKLIKNIDNTITSEISEIFTKDNAFRGYW
ncbi:MAG: hypothetical protein KAH95_10075 [Spirochaetales bacterium]|nr:hypothetical protein [Spirochaetales bacterium]